MMIMTLKRIARAAGALALVVAGFSGASAMERLGIPQDYGLWLQNPANEQAQRVADFNELLLIIITVITVFVMALMMYTLLRYRKPTSKTPASFSHNTLVEIVWTVIPILILIGISVVSIPLLYYQETIPETEFAVRVTGNQWNWTYSYPDHGDIEFTSVLVPDEAFADSTLKARYENDLSSFLGRPAQLNARLLDTDNRLVVPVDTKIKLLITASDVIHSWTVPAFGVKMDAIPGRLNETWFEVDEIGTYYGQCSELCGKDHAFMPIAVEVVSRADFDRWVDLAKQEYAAAPRVQLGR